VTLEVVRPLSYTPALDAIRGVAILLVVAFHTGRVLPGGQLGVDLFFVLSGFLITSLLVTEMHQHGRISLRGFYRRRALRLLPALVAMLAIYLTVVWLSGQPLREPTRGAILGATYTVNIAQDIGGPLEAEGMRHLWSLAVEEQFYLLWPPLLLLLLWRRVSPRWILVALGSAAVLSVAARFLSDGYPYGPHNRADGLLIGCAVALALTHRMLPTWLPRAAPLAVLFMAILAVGVKVPYVGRSLFAVAAAVLIVAAVEQPESRLVRLLDRAWLRWFGMISYGLYVWHWPIFAGMTWAAGLPVALLAAILSYRLIEEPFLRRKRAPIGGREHHLHGTLHMTRTPVPSAPSVVLPGPPGAPALPPAPAVPES
jgi:peptidoglycan/LPS O-acetylase OafA/YrhL